MSTNYPSDVYLVHATEFPANKRRLVATYFNPSQVETLLEKMKQERYKSAMFGCKLPVWADITVLNYRNPSEIDHE